MSEDFLSSLESNPVSETWEKVTEADIQKVHENSENAKKVARVIFSDRKKNTKIADFLSFLLKDIKDEWLISLLYKVFWTMRSSKNSMTYLKKNINSVLIVWFFAPFYKKELEKYSIFELFSDIYDFSKDISVDIFLTYLKILSKKYHDNIPINKNDFLNFLVKILFYYKVVDVDQKPGDELYKDLETKLYWNKS